MRRPNPILTLIVVLAFGVAAQPSSFEPLAPAEVQIRWANRTIQVALSSSLTQPSLSIKEGSDVVGAVRRAFNTWTEATGIKFVIGGSNAQTVSPMNQGDGVNLITIATTAENVAAFDEGNNAARTRVFYEPSSGAINEADIVLNPFLFSDDGGLIQFSTDGTAGTYDLESTLVHEIGHLLGLGHSNVIGATMQPSQGLNGTYGLAAITERSLSDVDRLAVRSLYGPCENTGSARGRLLNNTQGSLQPAAGAHIWIEDVASGRVIAEQTTTSNGRFNIGCIPTGDYRVMTEYLDAPGQEPPRESRNARQKMFRSVEMSSSLRIATDKANTVNFILIPPNNSARMLLPKFLGMNGDLSTVPVPARAGTKLTLFVGGLGVDQVPGTGFVINSPYITVDAASLTLQQTHKSTPVISFEVSIAPNAPAGEYSIRLQSNSGELSYLVGAISID